MKKLIVLLVCTIFSCGSPLNKSVFEPLNLEELKKEMDNDSLFKYVYQVASNIRDNSNLSEVVKAGYFDITYKRMLEFENITDKYDFKGNKDIFIKEWNLKYKKDSDKFDSVIEKYRNFNFSGKRTPKQTRIALYVKMYFDSKYNGDSKDEYYTKELITEELLDMNNLNEFIDKNENVKKKQDSTLRDIDSLVFDFIDLYQ